MDRKQPERQCTCPREIPPQAYAIHPSTPPVSTPPPPRLKWNSDREPLETRMDNVLTTERRIGPARPVTAQAHPCVLANPTSRHTAIPLPLSLPVPMSIGVAKGTDAEEPDRRSWWLRLKRDRLPRFRPADLSEAFPLKRKNGGSSLRTGKPPEDVRFDAVLHVNGDAASAPDSVPHGDATAQPPGDADPLGDAQSSDETKAKEVTVLSEEDVGLEWVPQVVSLLESAARSGHEATIRHVYHLYRDKYPLCLRWQHDIGCGLWDSYPNSVQLQVTAALTQGQQRLAVERQHKDVVLDFAAMKQRIDGSVCKIRCQLQSMLHHQV